MELPYQKGYCPSRLCEICWFNTFRVDTVIAKTMTLLDGFGEVLLRYLLVRCAGMKRIAIRYKTHDCFLVWKRHIRQAPLTLEVHEHTEPRCRTLEKRPENSSMRCQGFRREGRYRSCRWTRASQLCGTSDNRYLARLLTSTYLDTSLLIKYINTALAYLMRLAFLGASNALTLAWYLSMSS